MINHPAAIKFVNETIRPLAEEMRALKAKIAAANVQWFGGIDTLVTNDSSSVDDGREAEGVSRLTGANVVNMVTQMSNVATAINDNVTSLPCVKTFDAN